MRLSYMLVACAIVASGCAGELGSEEELEGEELGLYQFDPEGAALDAEEAEFLRLINEYRAADGKGALVARALVNDVAWKHSKDMSDRNYFSHTTLNGPSFGQRLLAAGYPNVGRGENIAAGNSTAARTFEQWKNSSGHNTNMLNPDWTVIGIGRFCYDPASELPRPTYGCYWTTDFGTYNGALPEPDPGPGPDPDPDPDPVCTEEVEPNDSYGRPGAIDGEVCGTVSSATDHDRFAFTSTAAGVPIVVEATGDVEVELRRYSGTTNRYSSVRDTAPVRIETTARENTRYQIVVKARQGGPAPVDYRLTLTR